MPEYPKKFITFVRRSAIARVKTPKAPQQPRAVEVLLLLVFAQVVKW